MLNFDTDNAILLVVDVQGKLAQLMHEKDVLLCNIQSLIKMAQILEIPIIATEQSPNKIGETIPEIKGFLNETPLTKTTFSCCLNEKFIKKIRGYERKQVITCGIETHVCIYQTVRDLQEGQFDVQVVTDAVSSRKASNKETALKRIELTGATLTSTEMIICELLKGADHPKFKDIMSLIK